MHFLNFFTGSAVPEGPTAYVLTVEDGGRRAEYKIWNASTGESYSYRDNYCPLQSIGCVANADNVRYLKLWALLHLWVMNFFIQELTNRNNENLVSRAVCFFVNITKSL